MRPVIEGILILVMSFNVRYFNPADVENNWNDRKDNVIEIIQNYSPDLLGLQEVTGKQLKFISNVLKTYSYFGESRSENKDDERTPIFYKSEKFELIDSNTFWLSETPNEISKGWDAALNRTVTWGKFKHREDSSIVFLFNTHFDHEGETARLESAKLLKKKIQEIAGENDFILTGDFNFEPASEYYEELTKKENSFSLVNSSIEAAEAENRTMGTINNFDTSTEASGPIDYIFVKPEIEVAGYKVINKKFNGKYPSDHFPVIAQLKLDSK